ncbi:murein hydrolase activator EnvC family protein [Sphingopyxis yananensis]|uniref:murein hydrolase activator EnvC family protein n=1 Tax=Sphingopyxis yananensis TaxID=2886687 RepID=UPI001D106687|nr:peptidoglycan DD-metalloendopeptidase family protein [Sphingopyxis yananensis]MCC2601869.1 peptidoglycan DD-metalloendopeptidase family protein [Sphingopyxis yananensis]
MKPARPAPKKAIWIALGAAALTGAIGGGVHMWRSNANSSGAEIFNPDQLAGQERRDLLAAQKQSAEAIARSKSLEEEAAKAQDQAEKLKIQAMAVAARIQSAEADIQAAQIKLTDINRNLTVQQDKLARQQKPLMELTALLQQLSRRPPVTVLAQPGSLDELVHARAVIEAITPVVEEKSVSMRRELAALRGILQQQNTEIVALETAQTKRTEQRAVLTKLEQQGRSRARQLASTARMEADRALGLGERARDISALMSALEDDSKTRQALAELAGPPPRPAHVDAPVTATPPPPSGRAPAKGAYRLPVVGRVLTGFGEVDDSGVRSRGIKMMAGQGAQLVAPADGRVSYAGEYRGYGKIVILDHGDGWISMVAGMIALSVAVGDTLDAGAPLGRAGAQGDSILVELRRGGKPVDIMALIS